ncbi:cell division control protein 42 homolog [Babylonia areolata]|uniref:cell division control protein 42 homolog n=1 Tax=Babylonia areolata TaxID=304850 RepID=UPI003FD09716
MRGSADEKMTTKFQNGGKKSQKAAKCAAASSDCTNSRFQWSAREMESEGEGEGGSGGEKYVHCALLGDGMVGKTCLTLSYTQHLFTDRYTATVFDNYPAPVCVGGEEFTVSVFDTAGQMDHESLRAYTYQMSEVLVLCFSVCDRESFYSVVNCWLPEIQRHTKGRRPLLLVGTQIDLRTSQQASSSCLKPSSSSSSYSDLRACSSSSSTSCSSSVQRNPSSASSDSRASSSSVFMPSSSSSRRNSISSIGSSSSSDLRAFSSSSFSTSQEEVSTEEGSQLAKMIGADCYIECSARSEEGVRQVFEHVVFSALKYRKKKKKGGFLLGKFFASGSKKALSEKALQRVASTLGIPTCSSSSSSA